MSLLLLAEGKVAVFYLIKGALGLASAFTEWSLYRAVRSLCPAPIAASFLIFLGLSSGMFVASTALLPSSFAMVAMTAAAAALMRRRPYAVIAWAAVGGCALLNSTRMNAGAFAQMHCQLTSRQASGVNAAYTRFFMRPHQE
jgi:hypothetical protein